MKKVLKPAFVAGLLLIFMVMPATSLPENPLPLTKGEGVRGKVEVEARSALVLDLLTNKILFEKNSREVLPLASITKIISSLVAIDYLNLDEYVEISKTAVETPEPSTLLVGEHLRAGDLLAMAMGESSNDAMTALVEKLGDEKWFLDLMREKAKTLGAETMTFLNPTGLDIKLGLDQTLTQTEFGSNFGSVYELSRIVKNSLDSIIWQVGNKEVVVSKEGIEHKIKHTNVLREELFGIYGAKTGFTDSAGGNLILIIERPIAKPKLIVILGSTLEGRFEDAKKLLNMLN